MNTKEVESYISALIRCAEERMIERCAEVASDFTTDKNGPYGHIPNTELMNAIRKLKEEL